MSEIEADLQFSAAAYLRDLAASAKTPDAQAAILSRAAAETKTAVAEAKLPDSAKQPTLNPYEAPPLGLKAGPALRRR
jgi:hypothetical protein